MTGRDNMSIWKDLENIYLSVRIPNVPKRLKSQAYDATSFIRKNHIRKFFYHLSILFSRSKSDSLNRKMVIKDSFITPYYKIIGCKIKGHNWSTKEDAIKYDFGDIGKKHCWNCTKWSTISELRNDKLKSILK